jgi:hypothetical protein
MRRRRNICILTGGTDDVSRVEVLAVYFLPRGRTPVPDWRDRIEYYARRVEAFHRREFSGQSVINVKILPEPFVSEMTPDQIRGADADSVFFRTLNSIRDRMRAQVTTNAFRSTWR